jgi:hypothetical protein
MCYQLPCVNPNPALQYNASYETSVRPQAPVAEGYAALGLSRRQVVAAGAAAALPVEWEDCSRAVVTSSSTATYCLPYSDVMPHPPSCAIDGKKSSFFRSAENVDEVVITIVFGGKVFLHRVDCHWYSYFG